VDIENKRKRKKREKKNRVWTARFTAFKEINTQNIFSDKMFETKLKVNKLFDV
jgi:hypothetical protein